MAFRETIEAVLKTKDAARFKAEFRTAAQAVGHFSKQEKQAAATSKILERIEKSLARQSAELTAVMTALGHSVDEFGDEMVQAAAKTAVANQVMKKSGSNAVFLGKSWAFWKDRLSLTRSEILTTSLTIGAYFSPAIVALGSSFAYAALGGGGVFAGGMSSFLFGLGLLSTVVGPSIQGLKDIKKAQDQYNLAVSQYGAASKEASRASAHLGAVVEQSGGAPARNAAANLTDLSKAWKELTKPARTEFFKTLSAGLGGIGTLAPQLAQQTNAMASATGGAFRGMFKTLTSGTTGGEVRGTIKELGDTFQQSIGPGVKGATNMLLVFFRILRATQPYVRKLAVAWEAWTRSLLSNTDEGKINKFFEGAVEHFKAWWALAKQLGRTLKIIWSNSKDEGLKVVTILTGLITKFNDWLQVASDTGKIDEFWRKYNQSVSDAVWALQNPTEAIRRWLPQVMDAIATTLATHAPQAAGVFIQAFLDSGSWAQLLTVAWFLKKFGFFSEVGKQIGTTFVVPFIKSFSEQFLIALGLEGTLFAEGGSVAKAMKVAGGNMGKIFGAAFVIGAIAALVTLGPDLARETKKQLGVGDDVKMEFPWEADFWKDAPGRIAKPLEDAWKHIKPGGDLPHGQYGTNIAPGGAAIVGESGPEIASMSKMGGAQITPLGKSMMPSISVPNISNAMHVTVFSSIQVDRREIGRAVSQQNAYDKARRGGHMVDPDA